MLLFPSSVPLLSSQYTAYGLSSFVALPFIRNTRFYELFSEGHTVVLIAFLGLVCFNSNPFNGVVDLVAQSDIVRKKRTQRDLDFFLFGETRNQLSKFMLLENSEAYYFSMANFFRAGTLSYLLGTREFASKFLENIFRVQIGKKISSFIDEYFLKVKVFNSQNLTSDCFCTLKDLKKMARFARLYKSILQYNSTHKESKVNLFNLVFISSFCLEMLNTFCIMLDKISLSEFCDLKGTSLDMYGWSSQFMVQKRVYENKTESLELDNDPQFFPNLLGTLTGFLQFLALSVKKGIVKVFSLTTTVKPSFFLMELDNLHRGAGSSIEAMQKTSMLLEALSVSYNRAYICTSQTYNIDPALLSRSLIVLSNKNKKYLVSFITTVRRKVIELYWKGLLTLEPIEEIIVKLVYKTYSQYAQKDVGMAIHRRFEFVYRKRKTVNFCLETVLDLF